MDAAELARQIAKFKDCPADDTCDTSCPCDSCELHNQGVEIDLTDRSRPGHVSLCRLFYAVFNEKRIDIRADIKTICPVCGKEGEKDLPFMSGLEGSRIYQSCVSHSKSQVKAAYLKMGRKDHDTINKARETAHAD